MRKRKFYENVYLYLAIGLIIVLWGFSQSYFNKLNQTALPYHVHGISAIFWMLLLIIQPIFYKLGKLKIHRYLGGISILVVPVIIVGGIEMMKLMIQGQERYPPDLVYNLAFIDACTLLGFAIIYSLAILYRRNLKLYARFMVGTIFGPLIPALTRIFFSLNIVNNFNEALTYSYLLTEFVLLIIICQEKEFKQIKFTYLPFLLFLIGQHILMYDAGQWNWWVSIMNDFSNYN